MLTHLASGTPYAPHTATQAEYSLGTFIVAVIAIYALAKALNNNREAVKANVKRKGAGLGGVLLVFLAIWLFSKSNDAGTSPEPSPTRITTPQQHTPDKSPKSPKTNDPNNGCPPDKTICFLK